MEPDTNLPNLTSASICMLKQCFQLTRPLSLWMSFFVISWKFSVVVPTDGAETKMLVIVRN